jgi:hypothetical protein
MNLSNKIDAAKLMTLALFILCLVTSACGGGGGGGESADVQPAAPPATNFSEVYSRQLSANEAGGILMPDIQAKVDGTGEVHLLFYTSAASLDTSGLPNDSDLIANPYRFQIHHAVWDPASQQLIGPEEILEVTPPYTNDSPVETADAGIDNCFFLGLAFTPEDVPVVVYQGGARPQSAGGLSCNSFYQGDLMVSVRNGGIWEEFLGIQGDASVKNPLFTDGMVGMAGDVAVDTDGNVHMIAQHYYEWCDLHGTTFPDLVYVMMTPAQLGNYQPSMEEWVDEHNTYGAGGGIQNALGYHCKLILDKDDQPVAFYFGILSDGSRELRMSRKVAGQWYPETVYAVPDDFSVGHISPAAAPDGTLSVAYFLEQIATDADYGDHLCYARRASDGSWTNTMVDYASFCGNYCSLALDTHEQPAIVYYDERAYSSYRERKDVKLAHFDGSQWQRETVATEGQIGLYNSLWFDTGNIAHICTYEQEENRIVVFKKQIH